MLTHDQADGEREEGPDKGTRRGDTPARAPQALATVKSQPWVVRAGDIGVLQRSVGNRALSSLLGGGTRPKPVPVQRHSIANAPSIPELDEEEEESEDGTSLQRIPVQRFQHGIPQVQRWGIGSFFKGLGRKRKTPAKVGAGSGGGDLPGVDPLGVAPPGIGSREPDVEDVGGGPGAAIDGPLVAPATPTPSPWTAATGGGAPGAARRIVPSPVTIAYATKELKADGSTATPTVTGGSSRGATWTIEGPAYGSTIDAKTGTLTSGTKLGAVDSASVTVKLGGALGSATTQVELVRGDVWQARRDVGTFLSEGPFAASGETRGRHGKWDASYDPSAKHLAVSVPMSFDFVNEPDQPTDTVEQKKKRADEQQQYVDTFIGQVTSRWSGKFKIKNTRQPASVWGVLGPVAISVGPRVVKDHKEVPYFNIKVDRAATGTASVGREQDNPAQRQAALFKDTPKMATSEFMPGIRTDEIARLGTVAPFVFATRSGGVQKGSQPTVDFLGQYLRGMHRPEFVIEIIGRDKTSEGTAKDRAKVVQTALGDVAPHTTKLSGVVDKSLTRSELSKVGFAPAYRDPAFTVPYDISAHEFGHMLGLPDEYENSTQAVGAGLGTQPYIARALGKAYADETAKVVADSASVMHSGDDLRIQHYAYFWDMLVTLSQRASAPTPKFGDADWKLYE